MKIIGKRDRGFIIDVSEGEIAKLIGYYYMGDSDCPRLKVGDEINLGEMYMQLYTLNGNTKIPAAIRELRALADRLEVVKPVIEHCLEESDEHN